MTEFVGRTGSRRVYSYPESRRNTTVPFARNFAIGPLDTTTIATGDSAAEPPTGGTEIPWALIEAGAPLWSASRTYAIGDIVTDPGFGTFIALASSTNVQPNTSVGVKWALNGAVPITPRSSGIILVSGSVTVVNSDAAQDVTLFVRVNGAAITGYAVRTTVPTEGSTTVPFLLEGENAAVGVTLRVSILLISEGDPSTLSIFVLDQDTQGHAAESATLELQEVIAATG